MRGVALQNIISAAVGGYLQTRARFDAETLYIVEIAVKGAFGDAHVAAKGCLVHGSFREQAVKKTE